MVDNQVRPGIESLPQVGGRGSVAGDVTRVLRRAILVGAFAEGEHLSLGQLAAQLGVSMMPVREALVGLANEGLVVNEPNKGFRATPLGQQDLDDVYALHAHISGLLAERAAPVITDNDLSTLKEIHGEFERAAEGLDLSVSHQVLEELNNKFHRYLNGIGEGTRLRWFLRLTSRLMGYVNVDGWCGTTLQEHPKIVAALEAKDGPRAARLVEDHFLHGATLVRRGQTSQDAVQAGGREEPGR